MPKKIVLKEVTVRQIKNHKPFFDGNKNGWYKFCLKCSQIKTVCDFKFSRGTPQCCKLCWNSKERKLYNQLTAEKKIALRKKRRENQTPQQIEARKSYLKDYFNNPENLKRKNANQRRRYKTWTPEQKEKYRENINKGVRAYQSRKMNAPFITAFSVTDIIKRDGLDCYLCGKTLTIKTATIDHITPLCRGGNHKPENAKIACKSCNCKKRHRTLTEYKKYRGDYLTVKI